ncbi:FemAB family protein [Maribacter vaceletii]|uniref:FemAB family protein n=1 Tax=Maribacter vaceletii TaxID=1206816 RepID=A0A495DSP1_9FLAO|nr:peptidoglycan bridge formation glycyltransferase FemA/FemB family protein [Maribacter vaceletii]RKR07179.1 FemAB family protein [Maribacter vaceletii]
MITIVESHDEWNKTLESFSVYDFYHTYDYHIISKKEEEKPILFIYRDKDVEIAIPFLKRPIANTNYFDLTSVYGYAGPVTKNLTDSFDNKKFHEAFETLLTKMQIISLFSRLHPYIDNQEKILSGLGEIPILGKVVNIDLTKDIAEQRTQYGKSTKNRTNKCRKISSVIKAKNEDQINTFIDIYYENMDRLAATKDYYFSREYFFKFLECKDFVTNILLVINNETGEAMAGSMFVKTKNIVQFHLSGSRTKFLNVAPANVFLDEMRIKATEEGYSIFNLGGGLGGQEDSLFNFKASFSKDFREFKVWKYIVDQKIYNSLISNEKLETTFFPAYRA